MTRHAVPGALLRRARSRQRAHSACMWASMKRKLGDPFGFVKARRAGTATSAKSGEVIFAKLAMIEPRTFGCG